MKLTKVLGMIATPVIHSIKEDDNDVRFTKGGVAYRQPAPGATMPPPPMPTAQQSTPTRAIPDQQQTQQKAIQRKQMMQAHMPTVQQATKIQGDLEQATKTLRGSLMGLKTKQAVSDVQHLTGLVQQLQQLLTTLPVLESKQLNEDHMDALETSVMSALEHVAQNVFKTNLTIKAGRYDEAIKLMADSVKSLTMAIDHLKPRALEGSLI